jgi:hypothetical protein
MGKVETPRSSDPMMQRPCTDREEKRVNRGSGAVQKRTEQEQLDVNAPIRADA